MRQLRTPSYFFRLVTAVLLAVLLQACTKWSAVPEPRTLATDAKGTVRLTMTGDAKNKVVKNPTVVGDSIIWESPERGSVALSQVAWVEARSLDPVATGFFALAGVTFILVKTLRD